MNDKKKLFETMAPGKALLIMALPTVASQLILLVYNIADTWFIGRTNDTNMVGASNLALTIYMILASIANIFGVGGGSLMVRHIGEKRVEDAKKVAIYSLFFSAITSAAFSVLSLILMTPLLYLLGARDLTLVYGKQYLLTTVVLGGIPTVLSMSMPQLLRNAGYAKEAGIGVALGSALNVVLDPIFMFVILPKGNEVLGAGIATMLANAGSFVYFLFVFKKVQKESVLSLTFKPVRIEKEDKKSLYMVGIPAAISIFLFDLVIIVTNRLMVTYGDGVKPLAAFGIVSKIERIPINVGLGVCLGMVPLIAYNFGARNYERMDRVSDLARRVITGFALVCALCFFFFAEPVVGAFIKDKDTVSLGAVLLQGRCFALPLMMVGYHVVNYMNAINKGKVSFLSAIIRHIVLLVPALVIMNSVWGLPGLIFAPVVADSINAVVSIVIFAVVRKKCIKEVKNGTE